MGVRDILMMIIGYGLVPVALYNPFWALMAYSWLSFMRPQSLIWSEEVQSSRFVLLVGIMLIFRAFVSYGPKVRLGLPTVTFILFWAWVIVCTVFSTHPEQSWVFTSQFNKIGVAVVLMTGLIRTRAQLKAFVLLLAFCPGFYGVKLGQFLLMGNTVTYQGGPAGMDNNDLAMFVSMGIPMLVFATSEVKRRWVRGGMYAAAVLCVPAVIVGESRGGMLAMVITGVITIFRKTTLWRALAIMLVLAPFAYAIVPASTMTRYHTINTYETDPAALGRIDAWRTSWRMAMNDPGKGVGVGAETFMAEYDRYKSRREDYAHVAHSIWFTALAGMGFPGLFLLIVLIGSVFLTTWRVRRLAARSLGDEGKWAVDYAKMIETSVLAYMIGGTFLSQIGFEFLYAVLLLSVPLYSFTREAVEERETIPKVPLVAEARGAMA